VIPLLVGAGAAAGALLAHGVYAPTSPVFGPVIGRGRDPRRVYLTFDDGPNPGVTERILDTLAEHGVPAAFFVVGGYAERFPALVRRIADGSHEIGNHTWSHVKLHRSGPARVRAELERTDAVLRDLLGRPVRLFRAPHGYRTPLVTRAAARLGYSVVGWSLGVWDTARPGAEEIRRRVRSRLRGGGILLLHDGDGYAMPGAREQTADALPGIIRDARAAGLIFAPLGELLA